jgi:short-subunit dehydrogenase
MKESLQGKNCLITGATGGLGKEIARELAKNGCNLFLTGKNNEKLDLLKDELETNSGMKMNFEQADLSNSEEIKKLIKKVKNSFSNIDILVNCAGIFPVNLLSDSTIEDFEKCFSINVKAAFVLCKEFSEGMISNKWGRIVIIGSSGAYNG